MMSPNRTLPWLVAGVLSLVALAPAWGQTYPNDPRVFPPGDIADAQIFAHADPSGYGGQLHPGAHDGFFFETDVLVWSIQKPDTASVGVVQSNGRPVWWTNDSNLDYQFSELDTSQLRSSFTTGQRFVFGYADEANGWMADIYHLGGKLQTIMASNVDVVFDDPVIGQYNERRLQGLVNHINGVPNYPDMPGSPGLLPYIATNQRLLNMPITFTDMTVTNRIDNFNVELMYTRRFKQFHNGSNLELYFGARYFEFKEQFNVEALGGVLADSYWNTEARNQIIGPEVGGRWWRQTGRWKVSLDGRFTAGLNQQNMRQVGELGSRLNPPGAVNNLYSMSPVSFSSSANETEFAPLVELRAELGYQVTRAIVFKVGWNGLWVDGLARPSDMIRYSMASASLPTMGIDTRHNRQDALLTGVNVGIEINR